jgi:hypothetical protein
MKSITSVNQPRLATLVAVDGVDKSGSKSWNPSTETFTTW